jgi:hypothetical protein
MGTLTRHAIPIFASNGEASVLLVYPYLFNLMGEWVGWVTPQREVYSTLGVFIGQLTDDPRILRKRSSEGSHPRLPVPPAPPPIKPPATIPLAPLMSEVSFDMVDVLGECPEDLHTIDSGDLREDMD